jgi:hypothetical protein
MIKANPLGTMSRLTYERCLEPRHPKLHSLFPLVRREAHRCHFSALFGSQLDAGGRVGGSLTARWALKRSSIAFSPRLNTGRNSLRYTFSVVRVLACPTKCAMSSIGIPALDSSETKLCRSSRGVHASAWSPARSATWRKARRTLAASKGVPRCVVKTRSLSGHRAALRCNSESASVCVLEDHHRARA